MAGVKCIKTGKTGGCHDKNVSDPGRAVSRILSALAGKPAAERAIYLLRPNPEPQWDGPPRAPYLVLLPMGFTVPPRLLLGRWALTPPFHPYPANRAVCFLWHWPSTMPSGTTSRVHPALKRGLRGIAPCGVRTFLPQQAGGDPPPSGIGEPSQATGLPPAKQAAWPSGVDFGQAILKRGAASTPYNHYP